MTTSTRTMAPDMGLFLVLALFANLIFAISAGGVSARDLLHEFYLIALVHIGLSLYAGVFDRARTVTWIILVLGWTLAECASFAGYVVPKGQLLFWLASNTPWAVPVLEQLAAAPSIVPIVLLVLLAIDVLFAYRNLPNARPWPWLAALIVAAAALGPLSGIVLAHVLPPPAPQSPLSFDVVPSWHLLPYYALLRAVPDKTLGLALAFFAIAAPVLWPWTRPGAVTGAGRWLWLAAWLIFVAAFVGLGYLGAMAPDEGTVLASRLAAAYYFAFILVIPLLFRRVRPSVPA